MHCSKHQSLIQINMANGNIIPEVTFTASKGIYNQAPLSRIDNILSDYHARNTEIPTELTDSESYHNKTRVIHRRNQNKIKEAHTPSTIIDKFVTLQPRWTHMVSIRHLRSHITTNIICITSHLKGIIHQKNHMKYIPRYNIC